MGSRAFQRCRKSSSFKETLVRTAVEVVEKEFDESIIKDGDFRYLSPIDLSALEIEVIMADEMKPAFDAVLPASTTKQLDVFYYDPAPPEIAEPKLIKFVGKQPVNPNTAGIVQDDVLSSLRSHFLSSKPKAIPPHIPFRYIDISATKIVSSLAGDAEFINVPSMRVDQNETTVILIIHVENVRAESIQVNTVNETEVLAFVHCFEFVTSRPT